MKDTKDEQMDLQIDKALRNHLGKGQSEQAVKCDGFDPDMATAYAERTLSNLQVKRYETHLADCKLCRQMNAEYALMFADELPAPAMEEVKEPVRAEVKEVSEQTGGLTWASVKEWLFGSQVRWVTAALLVLFISGAVWMFSSNNDKATNQTVGTDNKVEKNVQQPESNPNKVDGSQTASNNGSPDVVPTPVSTPENNSVKTPTPKQNPDGTKVDPSQTPNQGQVTTQEKVEVANKDNKGNSVKLPSLTKDEGLTDVANNNKLSTPLPGTDPLQLPPPPKDDIAQNTEKNNPKNPSTNSVRTPRPTTDLSIGFGDFTDKKSVGGKTFLLKSGVWTDQEYLTNSKTKGLKKQELKKGTEDYQKAITNNPALKNYFNLGTSVTVVYNDTVYVVK